MMTTTTNTSDFIAILLQKLVTKQKNLVMQLED
jgi:hypothetical protein